MLVTKLELCLEQREVVLWRTPHRKYCRGGGDTLWILPAPFILDGQLCFRQRRWSLGFPHWLNLEIWGVIALDLMNRSPRGISTLHGFQKWLLGILPINWTWSLGSNLHSYDETWRPCKPSRFYDEGSWGMECCKPPGVISGVGKLDKRWQPWLNLNRKAWLWDCYFIM